MCGISGIFANEQVDLKVVEDSIRKISHRGPDEEGFFVNQNCVLGMCRLAIIDVSSGQQPSYSETREIVSVFNGEIYNFRELRQSLLSRGHVIGGSGDSAIIPYLYQEFGEMFVNKLQGMFAIALFDLKKNRLILARDRLGKKPLWYSHQGNHFYFSSEVKGLFALGVERNLDIKAIPEFLRYGYINSPRSAIVGIEQLPPASILSFERGNKKIFQYWNSSNVEETSISFEDAKQETMRLLREAVKTRLVSERSIGAFLSGGIDSTIITALMQQESESPVHTFSIGFSDSEFDESKYSKVIASAIGTNHHEKKIDVDPFLIVDTLARAMDQPFADSSIVPTFLLSRFARDEVVVALSGDGGDEGFAGYDRYRAGKFLDSINPFLVANPIRTLPYQKITNQRFAKLVRHSRYQSLPDRYSGFQSLFQSKDLANLLNPDVLRNANQEDFMDIWNSIPTKDRVRKMQEMDIKTYLPGDLMYKVDISSMANSLEVRSPFLDFRVVEFGLSLPWKYKIGNGENKHILREIARTFVPSSLIDRPKMGFGIPRAKWLRGGLRDTVQQILLDDTSKSRGWYQFDKVEDLVNKHNNGMDFNYLIWPMFMLELWAKTWINS